jgi:S1-C subfamily serine protease
MSDPAEWEIKADWQPDPGEVAFDLERALASVVSLRAHVPEDSFTASILGTERAGNGVVIDRRGLVLTIGYLVTEAETVWLMGNNGRAAPAHVVAYDQETGLGLVQALGDLGLPVLPIGSASDLEVGEGVVVAGYGGRKHSIKARVLTKREFAGYWEYVLDEAVFTAPAHPNWGGTALIGDDGTLRGIGSLFVQHQRDGQKALDANMVVPIDLLPPILDDLLTYGRPNRPPRPWLGMYTAEGDDELVVAGIAEDGPADQGGVQVGDQVLEVANAKPDSLADLYRRVWACGPAGVEIPLTVAREGQVLTLTVASIDRNSILRTPKVH